MPTELYIESIASATALCRPLDSFKLAVARTMSLFGFSGVTSALPSSHPENIASRTLHILGPTVSLPLKSARGVFSKLSLLIVVGSLAQLGCSSVTAIKIATSATAFLCQCLLPFAKA